MTLLNNLSGRIQRTIVAGGGTVNPITTRVQPVAQSSVIRAEWLHAMIETQDRTAQVDRRGKQGHLHVTGLIDFCPRQHALLRRNEDRAPLVHSVESGMRLVWAIGRAVEHHIREQIIANDRSIVFGKWTCNCARTTHTGFFPDGRCCAECGGRLTTYGEATLIDEEASISGNPDLLLRTHGAFLPVEIKSMARKQWDELSAPLGDHRFQNGSYAHMMRRNGWPVHQKALVVYGCKDYVHKTPYKVYEIDTLESSLVRTLEDARQAAMVAHAGADPANSLPPRPCDTPDARKAKSCACVGRCFA